jgi:nucleotide-binding universal stress UspA family protein
MNVLVATDGSKYGQWALNWAAKLPFVKPPHVTALHVLDHAWLRLPFRTKVETQRVEARSERILKKVTEQLALLKLTGTACKEQGSVVTTILKHTPKRDGLMVVGSQGLDFLDRFTLGSVSTKLIQHATCPVLVVKGGSLAADHIGDRWVRRIGQSPEVCAKQVSACSFNRQGQSGADSCERDPCDSVPPVGPHRRRNDDTLDQVSKVEGKRDKSKAD